MVDLTGAEEIVVKSLVRAGPWAALFWYVWKQKDELVAKVMRDCAARESRMVEQSCAREERIMQESKDREDRLMKSLEALSTTYSDIKKDVEKIDDKVERIERSLYA